MSAYMCSNRQLTVLAAYAIRHALDAVPYSLRHDEIDGGPECAPGAVNRSIGRVVAMLGGENLASLAYRYPDQPNEGETLYNELELDRSALDERLPALTMIKLCHHYAYQSSEHPGWKHSDARKLVKAIEAHAVRSLPGYDAAPWGL
jgi:hypothetical protein